MFYYFSVRLKKIVPHNRHTQRPKRRHVQIFCPNLIHHPPSLSLLLTLSPSPFSISLAPCLSSQFPHPFPLPHVSLTLASSVLSLSLSHLHLFLKSPACHESGASFAPLIVLSFQSELSKGRGRLIVGGIRPPDDKWYVLHSRGRLHVLCRCSCNSVFIFRAQFQSQESGKEDFNIKTGSLQ